MATDIYANCRFYIQMGDLTQGVFTEISGLQIETEVMEYEEGGINGFVHRLPGRTKIGTLTLKRGVVKSNLFYAWFKEIMQGQMKRRNMSVIMYDTSGNELMRWSFANAYPIKWTGPQFTADGKASAVETLELAHDGLIAS